MARKFKRYNNGKENIIVYEGDPIPDGYVKGMLVSDEVKRRRVEKTKQTNLERYGVPNAMQSKEIVDRLKESNIERYGTSCTLQSEEIKEKTKQTNLKKYGTENYFSSDDFKEKYKSKMQEKYGVDNSFQAEEVKEKIKQKNRDNLGVDYPMQSEEVRDKSKRTSLEKYGTEYPNQSDIVKERIVQSNLEKYGREHPAQSPYIKEKARLTNQERYGVDWTCLTQEVRGHMNNDSGPNREFAKLLDSEGIQYEREFSLDHYSYDFKVGNNLIEINPTATHNSLWSPFDINKGLDKEYHRKKSDTAENKGFRVIHIFDWNTYDSIISILKKRDTVYARKCDIREVSLKDTNTFLKENHLQGSCRGQSIRLGLYYDNELVSIMTFGDSRYNEKYQYELLRYCAKVNVIGGAERLFKHFTREYKPDSVISYCDRAKFNGNTYNKLGFDKISDGVPTRHWYSMKEKRHITDNLLRQRGYDKLFNENYGKGTSNEDLIIKRGYVPVYDCGQAVYGWRKK